MNEDLKIIKKHYGEKFMQLCRELFATILDNSPGVLPKLLLDNFAPNHFLYDDLVRDDQRLSYIVTFKDFLYGLYDSFRVNLESNKENTIDPVTLMKKAGYTLYECHTIDDIQKFKKYYSKGEELCTFQGNRLSKCFVFFAVRDDADKLNRRDFSNPNRQDEYGTSVISIQFTRDGSHTLSIKNRYNHTVANPDATFSNNLDNIILGLTDSFKEHYGLNQSHKQVIDFEMYHYIRANDGRFYRYNLEWDNVYYCPNNIIIDNFQVIKYPREKYIVMDSFILDLVNKKITSRVDQSLTYTIDEIKKITINKEQDNKIITISIYDGEDIILTLNKYNQIIGLTNNNLVNIPYNFLRFSRYIEQITLDNAQTICGNFLQYNQSLKQITLPNVKAIGDDFLGNNVRSLEKINLPNVEFIGNNFCFANETVKEITLPKVIEIMNGFFHCNRILENINLPQVKKLGNCFCYYNKSILRLELPEVKVIDSGFLQQNKNVKELIFPKLESIDFFVNSNKDIELFYAPLITTGTDKTQKVIHQKRLVKIK